MKKKIKTVRFEHQSLNDVIFGLSLSQHRLCDTCKHDYCSEAMKYSCLQMLAGAWLMKNLPIIAGNEDKK